MFLFGTKCMLYVVGVALGPDTLFFFQLETLPYDNDRNGQFMGWLKMRKIQEKYNILVANTKAYR